MWVLGTYYNQISGFLIDDYTGNLTAANHSPYSSGGTNPVMMLVKPGGRFVFVINSGSGATGTPGTAGAYLVGNPGTLTSINTGGSSFIYLTDGPGNLIFSLQAGGSACSLQPISGSQQTNLSGSINPVNSITSSNGKFLYVLNYSNTNNPVGTANSTISAFTINSQGQIGQLSDSTNNPYAVGSGPTCIVQDPSSQYLYISDYNDSTVTGKLLNQNTGYLSDLGRGTVFPTSMKPSCLAVSGNL
jgi:6-phosphogluconolactonase (cycloisomerase 2 family)